jgi:hypothetical protein
MSKKSKAFDLFAQGRRPTSPEVRSLGLSQKTLYNYFQIFKKAGGVTKAGQSEMETSAPASVPGGVPTNRFSEACFLTVVPKTYTTSSKYIWLAMEVAMKEWHWPEDMTPQEFLERFLLMAMEDYGFILHSYVKLSQEETAED